MTEPGSPTAGVARLFDALADVYDGVGVDFFQPIAAQLLSAMNPAPGERWLDIGCGRGAVLLSAAQAVGPTGTALGIDISSAMVADCRESARRMGLGNVEVDVADAQDLSRDGERFDALTSCLVLFFLPDPGEAVRRWLPLLEAGGRVGITTFGELDPRWKHVDEVFEPYLPSALRDARTSGASGPFASDQGMEELMLDAGFTDARTVRGSIPVRFADDEQWHAFSWSTGQRAMWLSVPEDERPAVRAEAKRRLASHAGPDGTIEFEQSLRHTLARRPA